MKNKKQEEKFALLEEFIDLKIRKALSYASGWTTLDDYLLEDIRKEILEKAK